jgi:hypothetical protein
VLRSWKTDVALRAAGGDDSTCLRLLCAHCAADGTCVGLDVVPPGSGANADVAVASGMCDFRFRA